MFLKQQRPREFTTLIWSVRSFLGLAFKCRTHQIIDFSWNKKQGVLLTADSLVVRLAGGVVLRGETTGTPSALCWIHKFKSSTWEQLYSLTSITLLDYLVCFVSVLRVTDRSFISLFNCTFWAFFVVVAFIDRKLKNDRKWPRTRRYRCFLCRKSTSARLSVFCSAICT